MTKAQISRAGEGNPVWPWLVKAAGAETENRLDFMIGEIEYCTGPPLHVHHEQQDSFYILEGILAVQADGETVELGPGDFVTIPPGVAHTFDNLRRDQPPVKAINIMTPGGYDEALVDFNRLGEAIFDLDKANEVGQAHHVDLVGPPLRDQPGFEQ